MTAYQAAEKAWRMTLRGGGGVKSVVLLLLWLKVENPSWLLFFLLHKEL